MTENSDIILPRGKASYGTILSPPTVKQIAKEAAVNQGFDVVPDLLSEGGYFVTNKQINNLKIMNSAFKVGDSVMKDEGDYTFAGEVVSIFVKKSGVIRLVVEDERGLLFIFNESQLKKVENVG